MTCHVLQKMCNSYISAKAGQVKLIVRFPFPPACFSPDYTKFSLYGIFVPEVFSILPKIFVIVVVKALKLFSRFITMKNDCIAFVHHSYLENLETES